MCITTWPIGTTQQAFPNMRVETAGKYVCAITKQAHFVYDTNSKAKPLQAIVK
jgi:hypothetical protein